MSTTPTASRDSATGPVARLAQGHDLDADARDSALGDAELARRPCRQVDDAVADIGAAVVDAHDHRAPGGEIGDTNVGIERQGPMRRGQGVAVEVLAAGGAPAVEMRPVPRGEADLAE